MDTAFTRLVGCTVPLQQAGMGGAASPDLAVAVADAGALGMLGMPMAPAAAVAEVLESVGGRTSGPVGVNFLMPFLDRDAVHEGGEGQYHHEAEAHPSSDRQSDADAGQHRAGVGRMAEDAVRA